VAYTSAVDQSFLTPTPTRMSMQAQAAMGLSGAVPALAKLPGRADSPAIIVQGIPSVSESAVQLIQTRWWSLPVSDDWQFETEEGTVIITDTDEVGSVELSVIELEGGVSGGVSELNELAAEFVPGGLTGSHVNCGDWQGLLFEYSNGDYCRDWVLHCDGKVLIISYTCGEEHQGMDDTAVDQMLAELRQISQDDV